MRRAYTLVFLLALMAAGPAQAMCQRPDGTYTDRCTAADAPAPGGHVSSAGDGYAHGWSRLSEVAASNLAADRRTAEINARAKVNAREEQRHTETLRTQRAIRDAAARIGNQPHHPTYRPASRSYLPPSRTYRRPR